MACQRPQTEIVVAFYQTHDLLIGIEHSNHYTPTAPPVPLCCSLYTSYQNFIYFHTKMTIIKKSEPDFI